MALRSFLTNLIFLSLPLVATFKGKGTVVLVFILLLLYGKPIIKQPQIFFDGFLARLKSPLGVFSLLFGAWMIASSLWAPKAGSSLFNAVRYLLVLLAGGFLYQLLQDADEKTRKIFSRAFSRGMIFYIAFFFAERFIFNSASRLYTNAATFDQNLFIKGVVNLGFLLWPFLLFCVKEKFDRHPRLFVGILGLASLMLFSRVSPNSAMFGVSFGVFGFFLSYHRANFIRIFILLFMFFVASLPFAFYSFHPKDLGENLDYLPASYQHRLYIWHEMSKKTLNHPIAGNGFDYATTLKGGEKIEVTRRLFVDGFKKIEICQDHNFFHIFGTHTHNAMLQIWVEMGAIGAALILAILWILGRRMECIRDPVERGCWFGFFLYYIVINLVGFGAWQKWIPSTIILAILAFQSRRT